MDKHEESSFLRDEFPDTPARRAVVSVVRGFGSLHRQMSVHYARFGLKPAQDQMVMFPVEASEKFTESGTIPLVGAPVKPAVGGASLDVM